MRQNQRMRAQSLKHWGDLGIALFVVVCVISSLGSWSGKSAAAAESRSTNEAPLLQLLPPAEESLEVCSLEAERLTTILSQTWAGAFLGGLQDAEKPSGPSEVEIEKALKDTLRRMLQPYWPQLNGGPATLKELRQKIIDELERAKQNCPRPGEPFHTECIQTLQSYIDAIRSGREINFCILDACYLVNRLIRLLQFLETHSLAVDTNGDGKISLDELLVFIFEALRQPGSTDPTVAKRNRKLQVILQELLDRYSKCREQFSPG